MNHAPADPPRHSRKGLFIPFIIVGVLLIAATGWWFFLTHEVKSQIQTRLARLEATGWDVQYGQIRASGWPAHARITMTDLALISPSGQGVRTPEIAAEANSYNPDKWVIVVPETLTLVRADKGETQIKATAMRMSVSGLRQTWPNVAMEVVEPIFSTQPDAEPFPLAKAQLVQLYMRPYRGAPVNATGDATTNLTGGAVDVMFRLVNATGREGGPVQGFTQNGALTVQLEAVIENANALRHPSTPEGLLTAWTAAGGRFNNVRGEMQAGISHALITSPTLSANAQGRLEGEVTFKAERAIAAIVGLAGSTSGTPIDRAIAARAAAATPAAEQGADAQPIELTVRFQNNRTYLGPFALAPAPKLF